MQPCRFCTLELRRRELPAHERYCGARTELCKCGEWVMIKYRQLQVDSNQRISRTFQLAYGHSLKTYNLFPFHTITSKKSLFTNICKHEVIERKAQSFKIRIKGKESIVSIDRLKPAYILTNNSHQPDSPSQEHPPPVRTTRSGRRVQFPDFYRH
ncbi:unnamed protein product [Danaus chrysippus]|uniref:(African queen) hypothetical protein n=1 Tax=Danaus chrysippus TaxID=151541 RepID=A0A8J2R230_9NEOP|nr:unnamed protein product [Danaus chrysippus]